MAKRILDPNDPRYQQPDSPDYINDPNAPVEPSGSGEVRSPIQQAPDPSDTSPTIQTQPQADSGVDTRGGAVGITELPDGTGGTVAVPPPEMAPGYEPPAPIYTPPAAYDPPMLYEPPSAPLINPIPWEPEPIAAAPTPEPMPWDPPISTPGDPYLPDAPWNAPSAPLTNPIPVEEPIASAPEPMVTAPPAPTDTTPWMPWEPEPIAPTPAAPAPVNPPAPAGPPEPAYPPTPPFTPPVPVEPTTAPPQPEQPLVIDPPPATAPPAAQGPIPGSAPLPVAPPPVDYPAIADTPVPTPGAATTAAAVEQPVALPDFTADENIITSQVLPTVDPRLAALQEAGDMGLDALANEAAILPTADPRLDALQAQGDAGLTALAQEAPIVPQADPRLLRYREETDALMDKILNGPDRLEMAKQFYRNFDQETEQDYKDSLKDATDAGAANGQLFSGQLTNKYGDLFSRRARDKDSAKNRFMDEALRETFADRDRAFGQLGDVENRIFGQGQDDRGELRTERENRRRLIGDFYDQRDRGLDEGRSNRGEARIERGNRQGIVDQFYNERDTAVGSGRADRAETRGERSYQQQTAEAALLNRIRQYQAEQAGQQQDFNNAGDLYGYGNQGDPTETYMDAASQASLEAAAAAGDTGALLKLLAMRRQGAGAGLTAGG